MKDKNIAAFIAGLKTKQTSESDPDDEIGAEILNAIKDGKGKAIVTAIRNLVRAAQGS
jgi:hypothetical protein